jgi:phosphoribosylamine--glycine ligase
MLDAMKRVIAQLASEGIVYSGCLYGGFMLTAEGPKVLEFNARFGDPETQVVLPRMKGDLVAAFLACEAGRLNEIELGWEDNYAVSVVLTSAGYPGKYETGFEITGIEEAEELEGVSVFHAGDAFVPNRVPEGPWDDVDRSGRLLTSGGRVLNVTAVAPTLQEARDRAYEAAKRISFEGKTMRSDIAARGIAGREAWEA